MTRAQYILTQVAEARNTERRRSRGAKRARDWDDASSRVRGRHDPTPRKPRSKMKLKSPEQSAEYMTQMYPDLLGPKKKQESPRE